MAASPGLDQKRILAIDVGATNIKHSHVDDRGVLLERVRRRSTPSPCAPDQLVDLLAARIARCECVQVGVGFPGQLADGAVVAALNLARRGGVAPSLDRLIERQWRGFALAGRLREATGRDVRVANDAALAAYGTCTGEGTEAVLTFGTGLGLALQRDGVMQSVRDLGAADYVSGRTYDEVFGEGARARDEQMWRTAAVVVVSQIAEEFAATSVHLAGGNARRLSSSLFGDAGTPVLIHGNEVALRGAAKLFYP
jgi:polyphosphate glucokinase